MEALNVSEKFKGPKGPEVLVIMDGIGIGKPGATFQGDR